MANLKSFPNNRSEYVGAEHVMRWLHGRTSGVFPGSAGKAGAVASAGGMSVTVDDAIGWLSTENGDGIAWWNDTEAETGSKLTLSVGTASGTIKRIDRIVVTWEISSYDVLPTISVLKGTSDNKAPALTNNNVKRQISLAKIAIPAGSTAITSSMITDERANNNVCGYVTDSVEFDGTVIENQCNELIQRLNAAIASSGVASVNGKTGAVNLLGSDISVSADDSRTVGSAIASLATAESAKLFKVKTFKMTASAATSKGNTIGWYGTAPEVAGYTPIAITEWQMEGDGTVYMNLYRHMITSNSISCAAYCMNECQTSAPRPTLTVKILYVKDGKV